LIFFGVVVLGAILSVIHPNDPTSKDEDLARGVALGVLSIPVLVLLASKRRAYVKWNQDKLPTLVANWERTWFCHKCGSEFC
jgi:hypothetical protein